MTDWPPCRYPARVRSHVRAAFRETSDIIRSISSSALHHWHWSNSTDRDRDVTGGDVCVRLDAMTYYFTEQHDVLASHEEHAQWYVAECVADVDALDRVLQHDVRCAYRGRVRVSLHHHYPIKPVA